MNSNSRTFNSLGRKAGKEHVKFGRLLRSIWSQPSREALVEDLAADQSLKAMFQCSGESWSNIQAVSQANAILSVRRRINGLLYGTLGLVILSWAAFGAVNSMIAHRNAQNNAMSAAACQPSNGFGPVEVPIKKNPR